MKTETLDQIGIRFGTDKASVHKNPHGYLRHYDSALTHLRDKPVKMMEVGVGSGESVRMWLAYFSNPETRIYGVDTAQDTNEWNAPKLEPDERYKFVPGDQSSQEFWANFIKEHGEEWDIVVDDGGHYSNQVITTHNCLWPYYLKPGGFYCIEDLNVSYPDLWEKYGDCFVPPPWPSHMDFLKGRLDDLNRKDEIEWMRFSQQLVIIKKK